MKIKNIILIFLIIIIMIFSAFIIFKSNKQNKKLININKTKNNFYFEKTSEGIKKFSIKGDKYYLGNDKQIHVKGDVEANFYVGGKQINIKSDELTYTFDMKNIFFKKNVIVEIGQFKLYTDELFYADSIVFRSTKKVNVKSQSFSFKAKTFYYKFSKQVLVFVQLKDFIINRNNNIYKVEAKNLFYYRDKNMLSLRGSPVIVNTQKESEQHRYSFPFIDIFLNNDNSLKEGKIPSLKINTEDDNKKIKREIIINKPEFLWKNGKLSSIISEEKGVLTQFKDSIKRIFNFKGIDILFNESENLKSITVGKLKMLFLRINNKQTVRFGFGKAELSKIEFFKDGKISNILLMDRDLAFIIDENYKASGKIIFTYPDKKLSLLIGISGITFKKEMSIGAKYLFSDKTKNILIGKGDVKGINYKENMSFLCDIFKQKGENISFEKNVFIKKNKTEIKGDSVDFNKKKDIFIIRDGNITDMDFFIKGGEIIKHKNSMQIKKNIIVKKGDLKIKGQSAVITMIKSKYNKISINDDVKIFYKNGKGNSDKAIFFVNKKKVEMIGHSKFKREGEMNIEGDKLTLNLHNGKIYAISNKKNKVKIVLKKENDKSN